MKKQFFIGIDVSKHTLDATVIEQQNKERSNPQWKVFDNNPAGLHMLGQWLKSLGVVYGSNGLILIENTGLYHRHLVNWCTKVGLDICIENGAQVKWSMGISRGKNDRVDSRRLALYAIRFIDRLQPKPALEPGIQDLKDLMTLRNRHLASLSSLVAHIKELSLTSDKVFVKQLEKTHKGLIKSLKATIKSIESSIEKILKGSEQMNRQYSLLLTVPGIGPVTAAYLVACTNAFTNCSSGKQLACYCGVVPFEHQSGVSIKGKSRVHKMPNKELKRLLHMCALSALKSNKEIIDYVNRKVAEEKNKMSVLNAVRNKMVLRAFAVVKNNRPFVENYSIAA
jgi:transposase